KWMRSHARRLHKMLTVPLYESANHAWSQVNCALLSRAELEEQVLATQGEYELAREKLLRKETPDGQELRQMPQVPYLFRLPYARSTPQALETITALGLRVVLWDVVAENGSDCTKIINARRAAARAVQTVRPGSIILMHANLVPKGSAQLLKELVALLRGKGYRFATVGELLSLGEPETVMDGYFCRPGDNLQLDKKFGPRGTGISRHGR
ncbi:MAG: xylanase, partial [Deltaproteobacteria bacterium]|nr:xylanase [Deltaproteobacteria bacterium]